MSVKREKWENEWSRGGVCGVTAFIIKEYLVQSLDTNDFDKAL